LVELIACLGKSSVIIRDRLPNFLNLLLGIVDFDYQLGASFIFQLDDNGLLGMPNVPEHFVSFVPKHSRAKDVRKLCTCDLQSLKPAHGGVRIGMHCFDMLQRHIQCALESPKLMRTFDFQEKAVRCDRDLDHRTSFCAIKSQELI